jgi:hypothetical protein
MNINVSKPAAIASSAAYCISGLSMMGKSSYGIALVVGKNLVPNPATGKTAFRTFDFILINPLIGK